MRFVIGAEFPKVVIPLIKEAKNSIDIIVFDWRYYPQDPAAIGQLFNQEIINAARRKVNVRAVINNQQILTYLNSNGVKAKKLLSKKIIHCKLMIIDRKTVILGSHNYTQNAFSMNLEISVIFDLENEQSEVNQFFNNIYNSYNI